jgi:predicted KAP-like P-loop ATPase
LSDRAITRAEQDRFSRTKFVEGIANALVASDGTRSTGITVGLVGRWGEGKTSTLNLLSMHLQSIYPRCVVVKFNPWTVSNRDDMLMAYFKALTAAIREKFETDPHSGRVSQTAERISHVALDYAEALSPLLEVVHPWLPKLLAPLLQNWNRVYSDKLRKEKAPEAIKQKLEWLLGELAAPIVVIIDELDRVEDHEVRVLAQVVRAIADFEAVSYVLAYDEERVAEALGS